MIIEEVSIKNLPLSSKVTCMYKFSEILVRKAGTDAYGIGMIYSVGIGIGIDQSSRIGIDLEHSHNLYRLIGIGISVYRYIGISVSVEL